MSNLNEFLEDARCAVKAARLEQDVKAGLVPESELADRIVLLGNPDRPAVMRVGFKTDEAWEEYFSTRTLGDASPLPMAPEIQTAT